MSDGEECFPSISHPPKRASFPQWGVYLSLSETVDSATPGKPCVQNDRRVRWEIGRRIQFNKVCSYKLQKWTDFVLYQRHESIKNQFTYHQSKIKIIINQEPIGKASFQRQFSEHHSKNNWHRINPKPMHTVSTQSIYTASDFLSVGFLSLKTITLRSMPPTLSFCAEPKAKSQNPSSIKLPSPLKRVATVADFG